MGGRFLSPDAPCQSGAIELEADDATRRHETSQLSPTPVAMDELVRQSAAAPPTVAGVLLDLELAGRLVRHAGGRVALA